MEIEMVKAALLARYYNRKASNKFLRTNAKLKGYDAFHTYCHFCSS
jgi:hypothetical protein